ncbi:MAG: hypothetical protein V7603_6742 [Micromonosporaceae bacterium]|jgi:uncharacterized BrkB/YihY/UPF0761 family membrane protein
MSYPAYYGRPAMVARYRRRSAPASVHVVAVFQYLGALLTLAAAALVALIARGATRGAPLDRIPDEVRRGLAGGGLVIAVTLGVLGLLWLLVARKLQRGRQWARVTVLALSLLSIAGTAYGYWLGRQPDVLAGLALPVLYVALLSTRAARSWFRRGTW